MTNIKEIEETARREIEEETFRAAVEAEKIRIREYRSLWVRLFPWKITITKRS